jgi:HD-like signal output (HDOD) protein
VTLRVLFVDDEPSVLRSLARMIRIRRLPWDAAFVEGGAAALAQLEARAFDAVVSDLAMPGMDGVTLLAHVRARWPAIARLMLTGELTVAQSLRATRVAHQFLAKPCDGPLLEETVQRLDWIRTLGVSPDLRAGAARLASLPSAPRVHAAIRDAVARNADLDAIGRLAEGDIALTAKLVQLASTAFFTVAQGVSTVRGVLGRLGTDVVQSVLSSRETFRAAESPAVLVLLEDLCERSLAAGRRAYQRAPREMADRAQLAAGLHDVGRLVLACAPVPSGTAMAGEPADRGASAGAYLLGLWGLPEDVVHAVAYQHSPEAAPAEHRALATLVHAAASAGQPASAAAGAANCAW